MPIFKSMWVSTLNSHIVQGSTVFLYVNWNSIIYFLRDVFSIFRNIFLFLFSPKLFHSWRDKAIVYVTLFYPHIKGYWLPCSENSYILTFSWRPFPVWRFRRGNQPILEWSKCPVLHWEKLSKWNIIRQRKVVVELKVIMLNSIINIVSKRVKLENILYCFFASSLMTC